MSAVIRNSFYGAIALTLALLVFVGFARTYYLREWFDVPPMTVLLHLHGLAFTSWVTLFVMQTRLIAAHNYRAHMQLGIAGAVVAGCVTILGYVTAIASANAPRVRPMGLSSPQFVLVPLVAITFFALLVAAALLNRRRPQIHKRLMALAMISILGPPVARLIALTGHGRHFLAIQTIVAALFVAWCLANDWRKNRIVHPIFAFGGTVLVISLPLRVWIARTAAWDRAGNWLAALSAGWS